MNMRKEQDNSLSRNVVDTVIRAGAIILNAGAEVYRVEETMRRIGLSIPDVEECTPYVSATGIMCTVCAQGGMATRITRIYGGPRNLSALDAINALSREAEVQHYTVREINQRLDRIQRLPMYSFSTKTLFAAIGTAGFAYFFNGNLWEIGASFLIGLIVHALGQFRFTRCMNSFLVQMSQAFCAAILARLSQLTFPGCDSSIVTISTLMLLVPGLAITNAIRDTMMGDYLSGMVRLMESLLVAAALAIGAGLGLYLIPA